MMQNIKSSVGVIIMWKMMIKNFNATDIFEELTNKLNSVDNDYKRAVVFSFLTCIVAYGFQLTHVIMSPDMYLEIVTGSNYPINISGRWFMAFIRNFLLGDHRIVPTFNLLISIMLFISSSLLIAKMWRISNPLYVYFIIVIITINTYTNHILRWENAHVEASITTFIAILALYLSGQGRGMLLLALALMTCAHGGYQTGIALSCAAMFAGLALWVVQDGNFRNITTYIKGKTIPAVLVFSVGFLLHKVILTLLLQILQLEQPSRLQNVHVPENIMELLANIGLALSSIPPLFSTQVVYFNSQITLLYKFFFILLICFFILYFIKDISLKRMMLIVVVALLAFLTLLSTYLPTIVIGYTGIYNRILFPVSVFHCLVVILVLESKQRFMKNLVIIGCFCLIFFFSWHNNMYAYRSYLQDRADFDLASRIITRIESLPEYEKYAGRTLKLAVIGTKSISLPGYRFSATPNEKVINMGAFMQTWSAEGIFRYFHFPHTSVRNGKLEGHDINVNIAKAIVQMEAWPSSKSVVLIDGVALVMLDKTSISSDVIRSLFLELDKDNDFVISFNSDLLKMNNQIKPLDIYGEYIVSGNDPFVMFNITQPKEDQLYFFHAEVNVPAPTLIQLFYKSKLDPRWTQEQSIRCIANSTNNNCYFFLEGDKFNGEFRLDPGTIPGKYTIGDIEIREISPMDMK